MPTLKVLGPDDVNLMRSMLEMFARAFDDAASYASNPPSSSYLARQLSAPSFIAIAAIEQERVIGGLAAYVLPKFEQERSEIYIYDLAVDEAFRRRGIASALLGSIRQIAAERGAWVVYVQADEGDEPAIDLYSKYGDRERVLHFDLAPEPPAR